MRRGAVTGLPAPVERRLMDRHGRTVPARIALAAAVKALSVLVKRHPGAALDMAAAAAVKAGRVGIHALVERLEPLESSEPRTRKLRRLSRGEVRRFVRMLRDDQPQSTDTTP